MLRTTARILSGLMAATSLWGMTSLAQEMYYPPVPTLGGTAPAARIEDGVLPGRAYAPQGGSTELSYAMPGQPGVATGAPMGAPAMENKQGAITALLAGRKALAVSDVKTATAKSAEARSLYSGWTPTTDSPDRLDRTIATYEKLRAERELRGNSDAWKRQFALSVIEQAEAFICWKEYDEAERLIRFAAPYQSLFTTYDGTHPAMVSQKIMEARRAAALTVAAATPAASATSFPGTALAVNPEIPATAAPVAPTTDYPAAGAPTSLATVQSASPLGTQLRSGTMQVAGDLLGELTPLPTVQPTAAVTPSVPAPVLADASAGVVNLSSSGISTAEPSLEMTAARQQAFSDRMRQAVNGRIAQANQVSQSDLQQAEAILNQTLAELSAQTALDSATRNSLISALERSLESVRTIRDVQTPKLTQDQLNQKILAEVAADRDTRANNELELQRLVDRFNELMSQHKFDEAETVAKRAMELYPNSTIAVQIQKQWAMVSMLYRIQEMRDAKDVGWARAMNDVDVASIPHSGNDYRFPDVDTWVKLTNQRLQRDEKSRSMTQVEYEITEKLKYQVQVRFNNEPLQSALATLGNLAGIPIHIDPSGITQEDVDIAKPVSLDTINGIRLEAALNLILEPLRLGYIVKNDVLMITSKQACRSELRMRTYYVADLVMPIQNFAPVNTGLNDAIAQAMQVTRAGMGGMDMGGAGMGNVGSGLSGGMGQPSSNVKINPALMGQMAQAMGGMGGLTQPQNSALGGGLRGQSGGNGMANFDDLIDLIQTTVVPDSWQDGPSGTGNGQVREHPMNLSLVINNTDDVHQKVEELLEQLRKLQDLQVTIEVRFITLNDAFFERIGVDFDFYVNDHVGPKGINGPGRFGEMMQADDSGFDYGPSRNNSAALYREYGHDRSAIVGKSSDGPDAFTGNLDIPFTQGSYNLAVPSFGGYDPSAGIQFGFAILSEIEAHIFVNAATADSKSNVLQAPKVTLYNGQMATVYDQSQSPFVTSVIPVVGDFAAAQMPVIVVLSEGTFLTVQAVVSPDRRFVRLTVVPLFSTIDRVDTFTFDGTSSILAEDSNEGDLLNPTDTTKKASTTNISSSGTTVQLPTYASVSVQTTVSVPDGGTILLGGVKRLRESRQEAGVPILCKIPYISRLFKNVGVGRETESLMMVVTPRIIIPQEEEEAVLGSAEAR